MTATLAHPTLAARPRILVSAHYVLMTAAFAVMLGYFAVYVAYAANLIAFPFDYDQGEGFELVDTLYFAEGRLPYQDTDVYPFYSSNYPPLFHVMAAPFAAVFGPAYWYGRLLGFLGTLVTASAIGWVVWREERHRGIAVLAGLAFLASNTVYHIGPLFRQHMTMVMFEMLAVLVLANAPNIGDTRRRRIAIGLAIALIIAAGYTKQLAYATALAALAFLVIRNPRGGIVWGAVLAGVGGAIFLWLNVATDGQWWLQTISANVNDFYPDQTVGLFRLWFALHGFLIVPAVLLIVYEFYLGRISLYALWFIAATANSVLSGKWGAGDSYFATAIAATCVLSGIFAARTLRGTWQAPADHALAVRARRIGRPLRRATMTAALVLVPLVYLGYGRAVLHMPTDGPIFGPIADLLVIEPNAQNGFYDSAGRIVGGYADIGHFTTQADIEAGFRIVERVRETPGDVLSEEAAFNLLAGKPVLTNPTQLLNLWLNDAWDGTELVGLIERQHFGLVVMRAQFYPVPVLEALGRHYAVEETIRMNGFDYLLFRPIAR
jgi:hypothetical protein